MEAPAATPALAEARETVVALTRQAGKVQQECGLDILPDEFVRSVLKWGLMEVCAALRHAVDATAITRWCSTQVLHVCLIDVHQCFHKVDRALSRRHLLCLHAIMMPLHLGMVLENKHEMCTLLQRCM